MEPTNEPVDAFVDLIPGAMRQRDARTMIAMMRELTGREPVMWGTIIGFGTCRYTYASGRTGVMPRAAFAPRKAAMTVYLSEGFERDADDLAALGPHTRSKVCLYLKNLETNDLDALRRLIRHSLDDVDAGGDGTVTVLD